MVDDRIQTDGNLGEHEDVREALGLLQADQAGFNDNRRWRYAVRDVATLDYRGPGIWRQIGPAPTLIANQQIFEGIGPDSGEVVDIAVDPRGGPDHTIYIATGSGGVWKSANGGPTRQPPPDPLPARSTGALALCPDGPR